MMPPASTSARVGIWFGCVALAAAAFALLFAALSRSPDIVFYFQLTITFALAGAVLYLPVVIAFKNAHGVRIWIMIGLGILIGLPSFALVERIQQLRGFNNDDPLAPGDGFFYICAAIVGLLASAFYVLALNLRNPQSTIVEELND